jgi:WD40 repeat protein
MVHRSPDGTCLLSNSADNKLRTFIAPANLLEPRDAPLKLTPYSTLPSPEPVYAFTPYPLFELSDLSTTIILCSPRDLPIRLSNCLYSSTIATYPLISPTTEAYLTPSSLLWAPTGYNFFTGTDSLIALFDVSRPGDGPITRLPTIPSKRHKMKGGGIGMRGIVSCLSLQPSSAEDLSGTSMLAAGTWTRWVSLYDAAGMGGTVANWSVAAAADSDAKIGGAGTSEVLWSPCGRYLFVAERKSPGVLIYDVRVTGRLVGYLRDRTAETNQRLGVNIFPSAEEGVAAEIWAGGTDGVSKTWKWRNDGDEQEAVGTGPANRWHSHNSAVTSVAVHPSGTVVATSSGQRPELFSYENNHNEESDEEGRQERESSKAYTADNSIKLWKV